LIKLPYLALCGVLDSLFEGRPIARFWFLETVARVPYFSYTSMITLYETIGWWRRSAEARRVHFEEEWNEFHHLLIMEALGGDQAWFDRFIGQHSALLYYFAMLVMWLISPTLAYNFSELIEAHAVDTYAEFLDANEEALRSLPPPSIAVAFYGSEDRRQRAHSSEEQHAPVQHAPVQTLYDVFERIRDDEASHVQSMKRSQDPDVRARARIVELGAIATAAAIIATSAVTVETVETVETVVETVSAPIVQRVEREVEQELGVVEEKIEKAVEKEAQALEQGLEEALGEAASAAEKWQAEAH